MTRSTAAAGRSIEVGSVPPAVVPAGAEGTARPEASPRVTERNPVCAHPSIRASTTESNPSRARVPAVWNHSLIMSSDPLLSVDEFGCAVDGRDEVAVGGVEDRAADHEPAHTGQRQSALPAAEGRLGGVRAVPAEPQRRQRGRGHAAYHVVADGNLQPGA